MLGPSLKQTAMMSANHTLTKDKQFTGFLIEPWFPKNNSTLYT